MLNRISRELTQRQDRPAARAMLFAAGLTEADLDRPQVGIVSSGFEGNPCNMHLNGLAAAVKESVQASEMVGFVSNTIGVSDGISMGTAGMRYSLPSRDHPLYVGLLGMHGNYGPNLKKDDCDLLVAVGMRFDDRVTGNLAKYAPRARVVHVDIDASEIGKNVPVDVGIVADAKEALAAMADRVATGSHEAWLDALPAAMGAALARSDRQVVGVIGDGGFQMTIQELATIVQDDIPVKAVILNNGYLGMVRQWQEMFFDNRYSAIELANPDFVGVAEAFGLKGRRVAERAELDAAIDEMLACEGPFVLDVMVEREENVFPMIPVGAGCSEIRLG